MSNYVFDFDDKVHLKVNLFEFIIQGVEEK